MFISETWSTLSKSMATARGDVSGLLKRFYPPSDLYCSGFSVATKKNRIISSNEILTDMSHRAAFIHQPKRNLMTMIKSSLCVHCDLLIECVCVWGGVCTCMRQVHHNKYQ